jgi:DNA-binding LacI/PurR family transcriptional regulator
MSRPFDLQVDPDASTPLATQISQQLSWLIVSGALREGDELPPVQQLADELGINIHTVRAGYQQLAASDLVSLGRGRRARVLKYDRTNQPMSGVRIPTYAIGVIVPEFVPFYAPLLAGIEAEAAEQPAMVFVANARENREMALMYLDRLIAKEVDGIVVAAALFDSESSLPPAGQPPIVYVDAPGAAGPTIEFDLEGSQYLATGHLIQHGHRRIGYITPPLELPNVAPKLAGHTRALQEAGIDTDDQLILETRDFEIGSGQQAAEVLLNLPDRPTAIAAASDSLAIGTYQAARSRNLAIPEDLAVVGNDNTDLSALVDPGLTTVSLPTNKAGRLAVKTIQQIKTGDLHQNRVVLDVELVIRDSCGADHT